MKYLSLLLAILLLASCGPTEEPLSPAEARAFARSVDSSIRQERFSRIDEMIDRELLAQETARAAGKKLNADLRRGVVEGLSKNGFSQQVSKAVAGGSTYQLVRTYEKEGRQHMIFRLYGDDGVNYHDFSLTKIRGKIRARDVYILLSGEQLSQTLAGLLNTLTEKSDDPDRPASQMQRAALHLRQQNYNAAHAAIDSLPASIRSSRSVQIMRIVASSHLDSATYLRAMADFERQYGNDPSAQFALFDHYFARKDFKRCHRIVNSMDQLVQDPMLDFYRGLIYEQEGNNAEAVAALERLHKAMPDFESGALELLVLYVSLDEVAKGNQLLQAYKTQKAFHPEYLDYIRLKYPGQALHFNW